MEGQVEGRGPPAVAAANLQIMEDKLVEDSQAVIIGGDTNPIGITGNNETLLSFLLRY